MAIDCVPRLTTALQSGSYIKKAKVTAILGLLSMCSKLKNMECNSTPHRHASLMSTIAVPEVVSVLSQTGVMCSSCTADFCLHLTSTSRYHSPFDIWSI